MANTSLHIKRIQQEIKEFQNNPSDTFHAEPLKEELHIWHFTIKGPSETEFEGGFYHGKIELPFDYPLKPPSIYFLTPSGRYEINTKICLTITDYHPEHWNPGWTVKTMLKALISYFPEKESHTGVGALEYSAEERKKLALQSVKWVCPTCGPITTLIKEKEEEKQPEGSESKQEIEAKKAVEDEEVSIAVAESKNAEEPEYEEEHKLSDVVPEPQTVIRSENEISMDKSESEQKQKNYQKNVNKRVKEERQHDSFEIDLHTLESALMQHILFYEAKQSIKFQRNALNVEATQPNTENENKEKAQAPKPQESANEVSNSQQQVIDDPFKKQEEENQVQEEVSHKEEEKQQIKKQIFYINILIVMLLVGIVVLFFTM